MIKSLVYTTVVVLMGATLAFAGVIFEDNFNTQPDWQMEHGNISTPTVNPDDKPIGYRACWTQDSVYATPGHAPVSITPANARGGSGKALTMYSESGDGQSEWVSDVLLQSIFEWDPQYQEVYVRFWMQFQIGWQWDMTNDAYQKFFRVAHYNGGSFTDMDVSYQGMVISDLLKYGTGDNYQYSMAPRYETEYYPDQANPTGIRNDQAYLSGSGVEFDAIGMPGDGEWHCWEMHYKRNSAVGVPDGEHRLWIDDILIYERTDFAFADVGSVADPRKGWNTVVLGGNNYNRYANISEEIEQWYAIDDFVVSTDPIGIEYEVLTSPADELTPPSVAVTNNPSPIPNAETTAEVTGTATPSDGRTISTVTLESGTGTISGTTNWTVSCTGLTVGDNVYTIRATDDQAEFTDLNFTVTREAAPTTDGFSIKGATLKGVSIP